MALGLVLGGLALGTSIMGLDAARDAGKLRRREARLQNLQGNLESERRAREFVREAQQQRAATLAEAVFTGGGGENLRSSTVQGARGAQRQKIAGEIDFFQEFAAVGGNLARTSGARIREENRANLFQGIGSIFMMGASTFGGGGGS